MKKKTMLLMMVLLIVLCAVPVAASAPRNGRYTDRAGHIFIYKNGRPRTGYFKWRGSWYYGHKTGSAEYPRGSVAVGQMRIKSPGRWYAYDEQGRRISRDQYVRKGRTRKILQLDIRSRNRTVRYIYGTSRHTIGTRYSTALMRMQWQDDRGRWHTYEGMQWVPEYVDLQP